ncbi:MAG: hypothetical protein V1887_04570 [Candidatus Aenigmatarchaeota archaeon]
MLPNAGRVVGNFFEDKVAQIFNMADTGDPGLPDKVSRDGSFYVEVKASAYDNGDVIKKKPAQPVRQD